MLQAAAEVVEELAMVGDSCLWQGYRIKYDIIIAYLYTECTPHATIILWHYFNIIDLELKDCISWDGTMDTHAYLVYCIIYCNTYSYQA